MTRMKAMPILIGFITLTLFSFALLTERYLLHGKSQVSEGGTQSESSLPYIPPSLDKSPPIPIDLEKDYVFQELKRSLLERVDRNNDLKETQSLEIQYPVTSLPNSVDSQLSNRPSHDSGPFTSERDASSVSDTVWHSVEHLLFGARLLEAEEKRFKVEGNREAALRVRQRIESIRKVAAELCSQQP